MPFAVGGLLVLMKCLFRPLLCRNLARGCGCSGSRSVRAGPDEAPGRLPSHCSNEGVFQSLFPSHIPSHTCVVPASSRVTGTVSVSFLFGSSLVTSILFIMMCAFYFVQAFDYSSYDWQRKAGAEYGHAPHVRNADGRHAARGRDRGILWHRLKHKP